MGLPPSEQDGSNHPGAAMFNKCRFVFREIGFGSEEYAQAFALRERLLRVPLGLSLRDEDLTREKDQLHFGLFLDGDGLIACAVVIPLSKKDAKIRQVAVSQDYQGHGVGRRLMEELESNLRAKGFTHLVLEARAVVVGFYEKLGYSALGDDFIEVTIPHRKMEKTIISQRHASRPAGSESQEG
jgi:predicted GNAT family N-acyltransferase